MYKTKHNAHRQKKPDKREDHFDRSNQNEAFQVRPEHKALQFSE